MRAAPRPVACPTVRVVARLGTLLGALAVPVAGAVGDDAPPSWPAPDAAGAPAAYALDFETLPKDAALPEGFRVATGTFAVIDDPLAPGKNRVLLQDATTEAFCVALATGAGRACADGKVSVRFLPVSGKDDAAGGVVFRARDPESYYLCRANGLEDNLRLYVVKYGRRWDLASATVPPPALGTWHTLEVTFEGDVMRGVLDGKHTVEAKDPTYATGWCGVWTKADSVTRFDDLVVVPAAAKAPTTTPAPGAPAPGAPAPDRPAPKEPAPPAKGDRPAGPAR